MLAALISKWLAQTIFGRSLSIACVVSALHGLTVILHSLIAFALKIGNMTEVDIGPDFHGRIGGRALDRTLKIDLRLLHIVGAARDQSKSIQCCSIRRFCPENLFKQCFGAVVVIAVECGLSFDQLLADEIQ